MIYEKEDSMMEKSEEYISSQESDNEKNQQIRQIKQKMEQINQYIANNSKVDSGLSEILKPLDKKKTDGASEMHKQVDEQIEKLMQRKEDLKYYYSRLIKSIQDNIDSEIDC